MKNVIKTGLRVDKETYDKMKIIARKDDCSLNKVGIKALKYYLKTRKVQVN